MVTPLLLGITALFMALTWWLLWRYAKTQAATQLALEASERRTRAIIQHMLVGLITTNENGRIETVNPAAEKMFGYDANELIGRSIKRLIAVPGDDPGEFFRTMPDRALGTVTEFEGLRKDGRAFPLEIALFEFQTVGGRRYAGNVRDISERREIDRMKDEFVSIVSHELRTPLTSIRGALQLVLSEPPEFKDAEHEQLLNIALNNCGRLIRIINDILDVSKIEAGQVELRLRPCDVADLARTAIQSVAEMARAAEVRILVEIEPGLPQVRGDYDRLVQVIVNLLSNAVKFAPPRSSVTVSATHHDTTVRIAVRDHGPGIAVEDLNKLFRKFRQLDSSATRKAGGTGLGLAIVKALVEQHGGSVSVESVLGEGTTFAFVVPADDTVRSLRAPATSSAPSHRRRKILVVDDDHDVRVVLRHQLEAAGYAVIEAIDGESAVESAVREQPDLITMDLILPGLGGLSAIKALSSDARTASIPVVILSAIADTVSIEHPFSVLAKPVDSDQLIREIENLLGSPNAALLLAEDDDDLRSVVTKALTRQGFRVAAAPNGAVAKELYDRHGADAVLLDLHMPVGDGFDLIEHIRRSPAGAKIPIIVMSGSNSGQGKERSLQLGANIYFAKPVDADALVRELDRLLRTDNGQSAMGNG